MVHLHSIFDGSEALRASFCESLDVEDAPFEIAVDEPLGGPVVVRVWGCVDAMTAPEMGACLSEAVGWGRGLVLDLLQVPFLGVDGLSLITATATGMRDTRVGAAVAGGHAVLQPMRATGLDQDIPCYDNFVDAFHAARTRRTVVSPIVPRTQ